MNDAEVRSDPRIETGGLWPGFHAQFLVALSEHLNQALGEHYLSLIEERVYVSWEAPPPFVYQPDVSVVRSEVPRQAGVTTATTVEAAHPVLGTIPLPEQVRERFVSVKTLAGELVTVVELLSPNNKRPSHEGQRAYLTKREELLWARLNLVEIDLLIQGERMPLASPWPPGDRFVLVARGTRLGGAEIYPISGNAPLPAIRFPLKTPDPDAVLDLQHILAVAWKRGNYPRLLQHLRTTL